MAIDIKKELKKANKYIDHTLLKPEATSTQILKLCEEAKTYDFMSVCINPCFVSLAKKALKKTNVLVCTVIGFPLGASSTSIKVAETRQAIKDGASEIDMVINIGWAKEHKYDLILKQINAIKNVCKGKTLKVIIETCLLTPEEIKELTKIVSKSKADFIKTSTGFSKAGATIKDVKLMVENKTKRLKVKAAGGIRDYQTFVEMIKAGADRIGASAGVSIMEELKKKGV